MNQIIEAAFSRAGAVLVAMVMLFGVGLGAAGAAFSGKPNDAAKQRAALRDTKRKMLNHDDLQF